MQLCSVKIKLIRFCAGFERFCVGLKRGVGQGAKLAVKMLTAEQRLPEAVRPKQYGGVDEVLQRIWGGGRMRGEGGKRGRVSSQ